MPKKFYEIDSKGLYYKKYYGFIIYKFCNKLQRLSKLVCLSKPVKVIDDRKDTSLLQNMSMIHKLRIHDVL